MLGYQSINDAWQIKESFTTQEQNEDCYNIINRVLSCEKCLKKLKEKLDENKPEPTNNIQNIEQIIKQKVEQFTTQKTEKNNISKMIIESFSNIDNNNLLLIVIVFLLLLLILKK